MGKWLRQRRLLDTAFLVSLFSMYYSLNLAITQIVLGCNLLLAFFFFFFLLQRHNKSIFRYLAFLESWMICDKFLQFMTATCYLGHKLITPDQAWKHAEAICLSPYQGHCSIVLLTPQHSIRTILSVLCNQAQRREWAFKQDFSKLFLSGFHFAIVLQRPQRV